MIGWMLGMHNYFIAIPMPNLGFTCLDPLYGGISEPRSRQRRLKRSVETITGPSQVHAGVTPSPLGSNKLLEIAQSEVDDTSGS